ncbi:MAG: phosphate signaling complex protein PhoU [Opitutaceae bacterium]|nr:phosphate signaling complex protein PhoU [Opitutaceae bacterium]
MAEHLQKEIGKLKGNLLRLCALVEKRVELATSAIKNRDIKSAREVIDSDIEIDEMEVEVEEECLKILALHQPVAIDLRLIVAILKINNDLERIGDLAVNIAERGSYLAVQKAIPASFDFSTMADKVMLMLRQSLDSFVEMDADLAFFVCASDDEVDEMNREMHEQVESLIKESVGNVSVLIHLLSVSRHFERIADHATNIAEDVIYMIKGDIVRHKAESYT